MLCANHPTSRRTTILRDCAKFLVLIAVSVAVGWTVNAFRAKPLPLVYQTPKERVERIVETKRATRNLGTEARDATVEAIGLEELKKLIGQPGILVLDARPDLFYKAGHIPSALNLSRKEFEADLKRLQPQLQDSKVQTIVVYCSDSACEDSRIVADALARLGFGTTEGGVTQGRVIRVFKGGWAEWEANARQKAK